MKLSEIQAKPRMRLSQIQAQAPAAKSPRAGFKEFAFGGAPGFSLLPGAEDILPTVGQTLGTFGGFPGSVGGAALGEVAKQGVKAIRGESKIKPSELFGAAAAGPSALPKALSVPIATTAATEGIFRGAGKYIQPALRGGANRLMLSVMKPARDVIKRSPNLGVEAVEAGIYGTKTGMLSKAGKLIKQYEMQASNLIKGHKGKINSQRIIESLENLKNKALKGLKPEDANAIQNIHDAFVSQLPKKTVSKTIPQIGPLGESIAPRILKEEVPDVLGMNLEGGQALKKAIYSETPQSAFFRKTTELPGSGEARRTIASNLRRQIQGAIPKIKPVLRKEAIAIEARNALENRLANESKSVLLPKLAGMGAGGVALSGNPLGGLGILAGDALFEFLRSAPMTTGLAKNLLRAKNAGRPLTIGASEIARRSYGN